MTKKFITLILIISYITTCNGPCYGFGTKTLFARKSHAQRYVDDNAAQENKDILHAPSLLNIPKNLGHIVEYHKGKNEKLVIHIQDRHIDPVTQNNIASIIEILNVEHNIYLMCLEGASKELDTSFYNGFEDAALKKKIAEVFVQQGLFTGPELYKITNAENYMRAVGAEDSKLYLKHLASYKDNQVNKDSVVRLLQCMDVATDALKNHAYSKELLAFDKASRAYANKQIDLPEYLVQLKRHAVKASISLEEYPNLSKFINLTDKESKIDFKVAEEEREALIRYLSEHLPKEEVHELVQLSLDFRLNKVSDILFHEYLEALMNDNGLSNKDYANLTAYIDYIRSSKVINHLQVFDEAQDLDNRVQLALCDNVTQEKTVEYARSISMLEDLYNLKLTHRNLDYMEEHPRSFDILKIASFLQSASSAYGLDVTISVASLAANRKSLEASKEFYKLALSRDIALTGNTLKHMTQYKKDKAILVTGGFHTQGITNILKEKDISYVVICPVIGLKDCEKIYEERINGILPDMDALEASLVHMLAVALNTGDIGDIAKREKVQERFAEFYEVAPSLAGVDNRSVKTSSSGMIKKMFIGAQILMLGGGLWFGANMYSDRMRSQNATIEALHIVQELPADQFQMILDSIREFYSLIEDIDAPQPRSTDMRIKIGKMVQAIRNYIMVNIDTIHKYALENNVDPNLIAAIILTEQMDMRNLDTDKLLPPIVWPTSRGPGQITERALKKYCAKMRWPAYANKLTEDLTDSQIEDILNGEEENIDNHILAIARIVKGIEESIGNSEVELSFGNITAQKELQTGQAYTSDSRGQVPAPTKDMFTVDQLTGSEHARTWLYSYYVRINKEYIEQLLTEYNDKYAPEEFSVVPSTDSEKELPVKSSSSGIKPAKVSANGKRTLLSDSTKDLEAVAGETLVVAALNQETGDRFMANLFPTNQLISLDKETDSWKYPYMENLLKDINGPGWLAAVIRSGERYDEQSTHTRIDTHDITKYLKAQKIKFIVPDKRKLNKKIIFSAKGMISVKLPLERKATDIVDMWSGELLPQVKSSSAGKTVARPLDNIPIEGIENILVVGDYKKVFTEPKLGETIIDLWHLVNSLCKKYPKAKIYVSAPYADFYLADHFKGADHLKGQVVPLPSSVSDVYEWGYDASKWLVEGAGGTKELLYRAQDISAISTKTSNVRESFINDKNFFDTETSSKPDQIQEKCWVDMVFDVSIAPNLKFDFMGRADSTQPYLFSIESFLTHANARNNSVIPQESKPATYYDKQGNSYRVDYGNELDKFFAVDELEQSDIWHATQAIANGLGFDNDSNELGYIKLSDEEKVRAKDFIASLGGVYDGNGASPVFNKSKRIIVVNVYAQTQSHLMGANTQQQIDTWATYINSIIESTQNTYIVFTKGGEMDADATFADSVAKAVKEKSKGQLRANDNVLIVPRESLYPRINEIIGIADAVVTLDTGMSHYANVVLNKPTLLITSTDILHWATPRDNVYMIERNKVLDKILRDSGQQHIANVKKATILLNVLLDVRSVRSILESRKLTDVLAWLDSNDRMQQLKELLRKKHSGGRDVFIDDSAQKRFPEVVAHFIERKANQNAKYLWPFSESIKTSSGGIHVLSNELTDDMRNVVNRQIAPIDDPSSQVGLGRVTVITSVRNWTQVDIDSLTELAKCKTQAKYGNKKVNIILVYGKEEPYDKPKEALRACGFTDTGEYPTMKTAGDFSSLGKSEKDWVKISQEEQIAMIAASIRGQNRAVVTITNDIMARGIADVIPAYLNDRMKGKVVIASMQGATQATEINNDKIAENEIMFSPVLANAVREAELRFRNSADQQLFILKTLPPINSKEFEEFIQSLMDIKTAIEATASAA